VEKRTVLDVGEEEFEKEVLQRSHELPVVVDFWAPWCGPCRSLGPLLEEEAAAREGQVLLVKVNTDEAQELADVFQIQGIPAVKAFRDGRVVDEFVGARPRRDVADFFERLAPKDPGAEEEQARQRFRTQAAETGDEKTLRATLERQPSDLAARYGLALYAAAEGRYEEALEALLGLVRDDRRWNDEAARKAMLQIFDAAGPRSEMTEQWRTRLSMLLF
jgi:putative thioredoxin